jgi:peptidyl-prolyl cis-trans isomerase B (cyclophilin B)
VERKANPRLMALAVFALVAAAVLIGCGSEDKDEFAESCNETPVAPSNLNLDCPEDADTPPAGSVAVVETGKGPFTIALATEESPLTTASFAYLVDQELYTKTKFHRIAPEFVIQGGDPLGDGTGGPGYSVTEPPPPGTRYTPGIVAMAKAANEPAGTSASQFFVVTGLEGENLPAEYALLGEVTDGIEAVERIARLGTPSEKPKETIFVDKITIEEG